MIKTILTILILLIITFSGKLYAQNNKGKIQMEINQLNVALYGSTYRDRITFKNNFGDNFGFSSIIYFPFRWSVDYANNFNDSTASKGEFNNRLFLIRPVAIFNLSDQGSATSGAGLQLSFLITKQWYIEFLIGTVWAESKKISTDGINEGFNLSQGFYLTKPIHQHFSLSAGFNHISSAHIFNSKTNHDQIVFGAKYIF